MPVFGRKSEEQRSTARRGAPVLARLKGERNGFRRVVDIGRGGFRVETPLSLRTGQHLPVRLKFPDLCEEVEIEARVAWRRRSGEVGLDLRGLDAETSGLLAVLIAHQEVLSRTVRTDAPRVHLRPSF